MPRKRRIEVPDGYYHVVARGNNKQPIYVANWSGRLFVRLLNQVARRDGWSVLAYCLMTNHYHLVLQISDRGLSRGMRELNGTFAKISNARMGRSNHLFGRRFWSDALDEESHLLEACRYVVLNPERAGATPDARLWRWGSLAATLGYGLPPSCLATGALLQHFGRDAGRARDRFAAFVQDGRDRCQAPVSRV